MVTDSGVAALIADNYAVEIIPSRWMAPIRKPKLPLHAHCLFKNGIHLGELWYLTPLANWLRANGRESIPNDGTAPALTGCRRLPQLTHRDGLR